MLSTNEMEQVHNMLSRAGKTQQDMIIRLLQ